LAAFSLLICSRLSNISDFRDSIVAAGVEAAGLISELVLGVGPVFVVVVVAAGAEVFASSTSPSSTSILVIGLGVETPRELSKY
jgi:hypothetical protein